MMQYFINNIYNQNRQIKQIMQVQMHMHTNLEDIQRALANKYLSAELVNEIQCMRSQNQIMLSIKQLIEKRKFINNQIVYNGIHNNSIINVLDQSATSDSGLFGQTHSILSNLDENTSKSKFTQQFESSTLTSALKDVQMNCSEETYETVKQYLINSRAKQVQNLQKMSAKLVEQRDDLASQILILRLQKTNMQKQIERYKKIVGGVDEEKKNIKKRIDYVLKKQNQVFKLQSSFAFKEKINLELKKRYERLVGSFLANQAKINKMYEQLDKLWENICNKVQSIGCPGECWRKDVMQKAKQQLLEERKLIKEQSSQLQRQYQVMSIVSEQFKRIFQQPQKISLYGDRNKQNGDQSASKLDSSNIQDNQNIRESNKSYKNQ